MRLARAARRASQNTTAYVNAVGPDGKKTKTKVRVRKRDLPTRPKKRLAILAQNRPVPKRKPEEVEEVSRMK